MAAGLVCAALPAAAQSREPTPEKVEGLTYLARINIAEAVLDDGTKVPPETPEEFARPLMPRALEVKIIRRGDLSAQMEACQLDWREGSFLPFMRALRANGYAGKAMAYAGILHGMSQGVAALSLGEPGPCPAEKAAALKAEAGQLPADRPEPGPATARAGS
ncbi:hypothetical protein ACFQ1E_11805 [Sphingomonas canadensis]|uniref:Uncharacterized protein n=1 Tax=Sphingomonas canadensis TaxID=1219257 RepID=A0ABW3H709_9SPHN|nr:hypothetical protein [Sphingomonas canadensis]MCW3836842.1 hypothetical protein [Sphingomonas canadensis]